MDEAEAKKTDVKAPPEKSPPKTFTLNLEIEGLPYIFKGEIPDSLKNFELTIHIPEWKDELNRIKGNIAQGKLLVGAELTSFENKEGEIACIRADPLPNSKAADLYIRRIQSNTWMLKDSPYQDARGLGRFLMDNFLALADANKWSVAAFPYPSGRLSEQDVLEWVSRKGFEWEKGELVRKPQQTDLSQPVTKLLEEVGTSL